MAGGIDWFRWHHGSVTDPKFQLVARRSETTTASVLAVWAFVLEAASSSDERGGYGEIDCESVDCLMGFDDGLTKTILDTMAARGLLGNGRVIAWEKRQPKREREDDGATQRKRQQRAREADGEHVAPCHTMSRQKTPRGEESREEINTPLAPRGGNPDPEGFSSFWETWPKSDRKQAKGKCLEVWKKAGAEGNAEQIVSHVKALASSDKWRESGGQFVPAPLTYLNQRRWEGAEESAAESSAVGVFV